MLKLNDDDGRAVDTVFDLRTAAKTLPQQNPPATDAASTATLPAPVQARLKHVAHLLGLLDALPADDPPSNLVTRTLQAVQKQAELCTPESWPFAISTDSIDNTQPQA